MAGRAFVSQQMRTWMSFFGSLALISVADAARGEERSSAVPLWGRFETTLTNAHSYRNLFTDVDLRAKFTRPDKSQVTFRGFHDGDGHGGQVGKIWKLRFTGYRIQSTVAEYSHQGKNKRGSCGGWPTIIH